MEIAVRQSNPGTDRIGRASQRCPQCHTDALIMRRRHISSPGWGPSVSTEYYDCDYCEASYSYSPADRRWKILAQ